jgi:hypothetical protein
MLTRKYLLRHFDEIFIAENSAEPFEMKIEFRMVPGMNGGNGICYRNAGTHAECLHLGQRAPCA